MKVRAVRPVSSKASFKSTRLRRPSRQLRTVSFAKGAIRGAKFLKRNF